jgi:hypothetical protein
MGHRTDADRRNNDTLIALDRVNLKAEFLDSVADVFHLLLGGSSPH